MSKLEFDKEYMELLTGMPDTIVEYQTWIGLKERKIYFNNNIDLSIVDEIVHWIIRWNDEDEDKPAEDRKKIKIYMTSNGGCVISGFALIDAIQSSKTPIETIGVGVCASMGALVLLSGHYRKAYKNTTVLIHDGNLALQSTSKKAKQTMEYYDELDRRIKNLVLSKTTIGEKLYEEKEDDEWYLFGDQAMKYGIVDEIM